MSRSPPSGPEFQTPPRRAARHGRRSPTWTQARERTLALIAGLSDEDLERVHSPIMSPLVWDLGHIAAYEDLWLAHRHAGLELLRPDLAELYDAFETPRAVRGEIEALGPAEARDYLAAVRARAAEALAGTASATGSSTRWCCATSSSTPRRCARRWRSPACCRTASERSSTRRCEASTRRGSGWRSPPAPSRWAPGPRASPTTTSARVTPSTWPPSQIARHPVSNASWMRFSEGGGYERREWWSDEGWAWKQEYDITHHPAGGDGATPEAPVCHVSWFEADAFARAHGARLPTEAEWEKAATWQGAAGAASRRSGLVWEWTSSTFHGYPGFVAYPYREYSEVFFGEDYRVLRGGSWATHPRVATPDLPQLGPTAAPADLRRAAPREGALMEPIANPEETIRIDSHLDGQRGTLARRGRARRSHAALQGTAAQALLRRARRRAVRPDLRAARVLPDARRARDPRADGDASWRP